MTAHHVVCSSVVGKERGRHVNIVDYGVLAIVLISLLFGLYKGFIRSMLGLMGVFVGMYAAYMLAPQVITWISGNDSLLKTLMYYTDASQRIGDLRTAQTLVSSLSQAEIVSIVSHTNLPSPFDVVL